MSGVGRGKEPGQHTLYAFAYTAIAVSNGHGSCPFPHTGTAAASGKLGLRTAFSYHWARLSHSKIERAVYSTYCLVRPKLCTTDSEHKSHGLWDRGSGGRTFYETALESQKQRLSALVVNLLRLAGARGRCTLMSLGPCWV